MVFLWSRQNVARKKKESSFKTWKYWRNVACDGVHQLYLYLCCQLRHNLPIHSLKTSSHNKYHGLTWTLYKNTCTCTSTAILIQLVHISVNQLTWWSWCFPQTAKKKKQANTQQCNYWVYSFDQYKMNTRWKKELCTISV